MILHQCIGNVQIDEESGLYGTCDLHSYMLCNLASLTAATKQDIITFLSRQHNREKNRKESNHGSGSIQKVKSSQLPSESKSPGSLDTHISPVMTDIALSTPDNESAQIQSDPDSDITTCTHE